MIKKLRTRKERRTEIFQLVRLEKGFNDNIAQRYDNICKINAPHNRLFNRRRVKELVEIINKHNLSYVLEIGCGTGLTLIPLSKEVGATIVGLDISRRMLEVTKNKGLGASDAHLVVADASHLPFIKIFDLAYCVETLHHIPDTGQVFSELKRVLKVGGRAYLEEPQEKTLFTAIRKLGIHLCSEKSPCEKNGLWLPELLQVLTSDFIVERILFRGYIGLCLEPKLYNVALSKLLMTLDEYLSKVPFVREFALRMVLLSRRKPP